MTTPVPEPPVTAEQHAEPIIWFWCPNCLLVSGKAGTCAGCKQPFQQASHWGIPYGPYRPPPPGGRASPGKVAAIVGSVIAIVAIVGGGLLLLFTRGSAIEKRDRGARSGTTTFAVPSLRASLDLPGSWVTDNSVAEQLRQIAVGVADGTIHTDVSARKGYALFSIVTAPVKDPGSILESNVQDQPLLQRDEDGNAVTVSASKRIRIANHDTVVTDIEVKRPTGESVYERRLWVVDNKDEIVFIEALAAPDAADREFPGIEQALSALG